METSSPSDGGVEQRLHDLGQRLTPQRLLIVSVLQESEIHLTAETIHSRIREQYPYVNISTVYRTLEWLKKLGMVTETDMGEGSVCYHWAENGRHHHLICQKCGRVVDMDDAVPGLFGEALLQRYGFEVDLSHLAFFGRCKSCKG
ncbi:MAG: Fur family transcriptional regulator [Dehalococcoidia bacterium]|nr:Fur family transcriptional regulator [Dehalococcoidia bacterium]